jgi:heme exporter protein B
MLQVIRRDLMLAFRNPHDILNPLLFFVIVVTLFPLAIGSESRTLSLIAPGIIWVAALLSTLLSLDMLFRADFEDGSLEQLMLMPGSFPMVVLGKIIAHWLVAGLPLVLVSPLLGMMLFLSQDGYWVLLGTLLLGTPILSLLGAICLGLVVGIKRGGVLLSLLALPLFVPSLIIGTMAVHDASFGLPVAAYLYILGAILVLSLALAPIAAAMALRISLD